MNPEIESWKWILKFKPEIETWNLNLKLKYEIRIWNWEFKLKLEIETWILEANSTRLSTLVLEVKPYLSLSKSAQFWAPFSFFYPAGQVVGLISCLKTVLGPNHIEYQLQISKYCPFFCFQFGPIWGPFNPFWALMGYIWDWAHVWTLFETYSHRLTTFILEV